MPRSCIALLSGGLDSILAAAVMIRAGIRVTALHALNCFHGTESRRDRRERLTRLAERLGAADIVFPENGAEVVRLTKSPRYGYGKNLNACLDCRIATVAAGFAAMRGREADFVVSGEVLGQRPMSQRKDALAAADREIATMGFGGLLLRPLSAKLLEPTVPEKEGWISREGLYDISGRERGRQMELAREFGIGEYPSPAGGCLLTDPGFSRRLAVLMRTRPDWGEPDVELLKAGRHFQLGDGVKVVVSRNEGENDFLCRAAVADDWLYIASGRPGAVSMLRGEWSGEAERTAAGLALHYSKQRGAAVAGVYRWRGGDEAGRIEVTASPVSPETLPDKYGDAFREVKRSAAEARRSASRRRRATDE